MATTTTEDLGTAYRDTRIRVTELVTQPGVDPDMYVPATPKWRVKDVVAHQAGVCADILAGNLEGLTSEPWTAAQVDARRDRTLGELLEEWAKASAEVESIVPMFPGRSGHQFVGDAVSHEHDLRAALNRPGERDSTAMLIGADFMIGSWLHHGVKPLSLPPLLVVSGTLRWRTGEDDPATSLEGETFELFRAATGRRSVDQIRSLNWTGDPEPYLPTFVWGPFRPAETDLVE